MAGSVRELHEAFEQALVEHKPTMKDLGGVCGERDNIYNYLTGNLWGAEEIKDHPFRRSAS